jgi:hypothetical protein
MLRLVALVALFAGFCWFGTQVPLGSHTLFGHLHAIAGTRESQDLFDGTRESAKPLVDDVRRRIAGAADAKPGPSPHDVHAGAHPDAGAGADPGNSARAAEAHPGGVRPDPHAESHSASGSTSRPAPHPQPREDLTPSDRHHLRRLISSAEGASARP